MGSFINPLDQAVKRLQSKIKKTADKIIAVQDFLGKQVVMTPQGPQQGIGPDNASMLMLRLELLIDFVFPKGEPDKDGMITDLGRLEFEAEWHDKVLEVLEGIRDQVKNQSKLTVPTGANKIIVPGVNGG